MYIGRHDFADLLVVGPLWFEIHCMRLDCEVLKICGAEPGLHKDRYKCQDLKQPSKSACMNYYYGLIHLPLNKILTET